MTLALIANIVIEPQSVHTSEATHDTANIIAQHKIKAHLNHGRNHV